MLIKIKVIFIICLALFSQTCCNHGSKRIILHSADDIMQVVIALQSKMAALESKATASESKMAASESKMAALESKATASESKMAALNAELTTLKGKGSAGGVTYIRWGRKSCPTNGTEYIYKGYMAGVKYNEYGGSNDQCLPEDPTWDKYVDGYNGGAKLRGTEIQPDSTVSNTIFGKPTYNQDIPCAVCRSTRASHVMIPARAHCYPGWTKEYGGYLISSYSSWAGGADYVCLDSGLEFVTHGAGNDDDHVVMPVEVMCGTGGSLPCPPFVDGRELACVVCTK